MLRLKDLFTLGNLLCGAAAILLCIEDRLAEASYAIIFAFAFDVLDGVVARLTGGGNRFGAELDTLCDFVTFGLAPPFIVYLAYRPYGSALGAVLGATLLVAGTVRHVRNYAFPFPSKLIWVGMPRPVAGMVTVAFVHSSTWQLGWGPWLGVLLVPLLALALLGTMPCVGHHGRRLQGYVRAVIVGWAVTWLGTLIFWREMFWDLTLFFTGGYFLTSWYVLTAEERREYREIVRTWKARIAAGSVPSGPTT